MIEWLSVTSVSLALCYSCYVNYRTTRTLGERIKRLDDRDRELRKSLNVMRSVHRVDTPDRSM